MKGTSSNFFNKVCLIGLPCKVYDYPWKRQSPKIIKEKNMNKFEKIFLKAFNYWLIFNVDYIKFTVKLNLYVNVSIKATLAENSKVQTKWKT